MYLIGAALEGDRTREGVPKDKAVLDMDDSYGSRTGVPGCADVMFGIGTSTSLKERGMICIHLCKNKRGKDEPILYFNVDLERCRFT